MIILVGLGAGLALLYGAAYCWRSESWIRSLIKTGSIALPAVALSFYALPGMALAGLWACVLGDFLLSRPGQVALRAGIVAFATGHVFYIVSFLTLWPLSSPDLLFWMVALGLGALGLSTERWLTPHTGALRGAVRVYVVLILAMGISAAVPGGPRLWVLAGALCFVLSDLILSTQLFLAQRGRAGAYAVWGLYCMAQALIIFGIWEFAGA
jgi:uncharacterized membrane protein YhhN